MDDSEEIARAIGLRLREERQLKGMTLEMLGEATGLSSAFLSRLERGESSTSIGNLIRVAGAIGVPLHQIFASEQAGSSPGYVLSRKKDRQAHAPLSGPGYAYEHFQSLLSEQRLEVFELEYPAGANQQSPLLAHEGEEEVLYLLAGRLEFQVGPDTFVMEQGDCVHLLSKQPHGGRNIGDRPARLLMLVAPAMDSKRPKSARAGGSAHRHNKVSPHETAPVAPQTTRAGSAGKDRRAKRAGKR